MLSAIALLFAACQEPFTLEEMVDGPDGKALTISPSSSTLQINDSLLIDVSGGIPPYSYAVVSGIGTFTGNTYTAPASAGTEVIRVQDQTGTRVFGEFTIENPGVSLGITPSSQVVYTGESISFAPIGGTAPYSYSISSIGSSDPALSDSDYTAGSTAGTDTVTVSDSLGDTATASITVQAKQLSISPQVITVYVNQQISFSAIGGDGPFSFSLSGSSGGVINSTTGVYTAGSITGTDTITLTDGYDGRTRTASVTVVDTATSVDYEVSQITNIVSSDILAGSSFDAEFTVSNNGSADGLKDISWTVYASTDTSIGGSDDRIAGLGSISGGLSAGPGTTVHLSDGTGGTWPSEAGNYYLLVDVYAADDLETGDNRNQSTGTTEIFEPLSITPAVASVYIGQGVDFEISGGRGAGTYSYTFVQSDSGSPSMSGDSYTAGSVAGTDIIEVSDDLYGWSDQATVNVSDFPVLPAGDIEYIVEAFSAVEPSPDAGSAMGESFTLKNSGADDGESSINWIAYASQDNSAVLSDGDQYVDSGSELALDGGGMAVVALDGDWPSVAGTWYVKLREWADDEGTADEWFVSDPFSVQPVSSGADVDYYVSPAPAGGSAEVGDTVSASFTVRNQGTEAGTASVEWSAYISSDQVYNTGDVYVDSDSFTALGAGASSTSQTIDSGTWSSAGNWYLLIRLEASDDVNPVNDLGVSSSVYTVSDPGAAEPDYKAGDISMYASFVTSGSAVEESFSISNIGTDGGSPITWTAYASSDSVPDAGEEIGSGTIGYLTAGETVSNISTLGAVWPGAGEYYLIIEEYAADEVNQNDYAVSAGKFTVSDPPDYEIQSVTYPTEAEEGSAVSGGFTIHNSGSGDGTKNISWEAFLSFDTGFSDDDIEIGSGSVGFLDAGEGFSIEEADLDITDWPAYGLCYLLVRISSSDDEDTENNTYISSPVELYFLDSEGADHSGTANDGYGPSPNPSGTPISGTQYLSSISLGQTLVVKGWLDTSGVYDTFSFDLDTGVGTIAAYASWSTGGDIGALYIWDELKNSFVSTDNVSDREPETGDLSITGWVPPETGYVGIESYEYVVYGTDEILYTIYISGED